MYVCLAYVRYAIAAVKELRSTLEQHYGLRSVGDIRICLMDRTGKEKPSHCSAFITFESWEEASSVTIYSDTTHARTCYAKKQHAHTRLQTCLLPEGISNIMFDTTNDVLLI